MSALTKGSRKPKGKQTTVVHAQNEDNHVVGIKTLQVMLLHDESGWFAQGLQIDYASAGASQEEAKENFEKGLMLTVKEHLRMYGSVEKLLKIAPQEVWAEAFSAAENVEIFSTVEAFNFGTPARTQTEQNEPIFPFKAIEFFGRSPIAAT